MVDDARAQGTVVPADAHANLLGVGTNLVGDGPAHPIREFLEAIVDSVRGQDLRTHVAHSTDERVHDPGTVRSAQRARHDRREASARAKKKQVSARVRARVAHHNVAGIEHVARANPSPAFFQDGHGAAKLLLGRVRVLQVVPPRRAGGPESHDVVPQGRQGRPRFEEGAHQLDVLVVFFLGPHDDCRNEMPKVHRCLLRWKKKVSLV